VKGRETGKAVEEGKVKEEREKEREGVNLPHGRVKALAALHSHFQVSGKFRLHADK